MQNLTQDRCYNLVFNYCSLFEAGIKMLCKLKVFKNHKIQKCLQLDERPFIC